MEDLILVNERLEPLLPESTSEEYFAIDLGCRRCFAGGLISLEDVHLFVGWMPFCRAVQLKEAYIYKTEFKRRNPHCKEAGLLTLQQIDELERMGGLRNFRILNSWTSNTYTDLHGRICGYYMLENGRKRLNWGDEISDLYLYFAFLPGEEASVIL